MLTLPIGAILIGMSVSFSQKQEQNHPLPWENLQTLGPDLRELISGISLRLPPFLLSLSQVPKAVILYFGITEITSCELL